MGDILQIRVTVGPPIVRSAIEIFWPRQGDTQAYEEIILQGALVLFEPHRIAQIVVDMPRTLITGRYGLASEHLRDHRPGDDRYLAARFEIPVPISDARGCGTLLVETEAGKIIMVARVTFTTIEAD